MNLKFEQDSVCFKITEEELDRILAGDSIALSLRVGALSLRAGVVADAGAGSVRLGGEKEGEDSLSLFLYAAPSVFQTLKDMGKNRDGLRWGGPQETEIVLQVDVRASIRTAP